MNFHISGLAWLQAEEDVPEIYDLVLRVAHIVSNVWIWFILNQLGLIQVRDYTKKAIGRIHIGHKLPIMGICLTLQAKKHHRCIKVDAWLRLNDVCKPVSIDVICLILFSSLSERKLYFFVFYDLERVIG